MSRLSTKILRAFAGAMLVLALTTGASFAGGRDMPSRAISPDATCWAATVNDHAGYKCQEPGASLIYFCTTPRTVCWPIIPPGTVHRGGPFTHPAPLGPANTASPGMTRH